MKRPVGGATAAYFETLDWSALEGVAGVTYSDKQREAILFHVNRALVNRNMHDAAPTEAEVRKRIERIEKTAAKLATLLNDKTGGDAAIWIGLAAEYQDVMDVYQLARYVAMCRKAAAMMDRGKTGASKREWRDYLITKLHEIWTAAGGRGKGCTWNLENEIYQGPFYEFCWAIWQEAELENLDGDGMASAVLRALRGKTE